MHAELSPHVDAIRRFNRFYTRQIGVLQEHLLDTPYSLAEARVLFEIARRGSTSATDLVAALGLDPGYLSRIVRRFRDGGLVSRESSPADGRRGILSLTPRGREAFEALDAATADEIGSLLDPLPDGDRERLVGAMGEIERLVGGAAEDEPLIVRRHRPGDMGWVVQRHGELYWREYGWNEEFEALVARIVADFVSDLDPERERCWIGEAGGERLGCVFLVKNADDPERVAQLRLLLVEPRARGRGLGGRLVGECTRFAHRAGYQRIVLWTNDVLHAARRLYEREGYRLLHQGPHHSFGRDLVEQTWELDLRRDGRPVDGSGER